MLLLRNPWHRNDLRIKAPCPQWPETLLQFADRLFVVGLAPRSQAWRAVFRNASPAFMWAVLSGRSTDVSVLIDLDFPADVNLAMRLMVQPGGLTLYEPPLPLPEARCAVKLTPLAAAAWSFDARLVRALLRSPGIDVSAGAPLLQAVREADLFLNREAPLPSPCTLRRYPIFGPKHDWAHGCNHPARPGGCGRRLPNSPSPDAPWWRPLRH